MPEIGEIALSETIRRLGELGALTASASYRYAKGYFRLAVRRPFLDQKGFEEAVWRLQGRCARKLFEQMGPTFIKLAQILSTRRDLFPPAALAEFEKLQDRVPPFDGALVPKIIEREFGRNLADIFKHFDDIPVASGSVAQVHRATLRDGREVAVKVLRPDIETIMERDIEVLNFVVRKVAALPYYKSQSLVGFMEYFGDLLRRQLDLSVEAANNRRFQECFAGLRDIVRFPELVPELCSREVMTMEFVRGIKPTEFRGSSEEKKRLAESGLRLYYAMVLHGLIHADLHPGNLLIDPAGFFWVFDLGLMDELEWDLRKGIFEAWFSTFNGEGGPFARLMLRFSVSHQVTDMAALEADVTAMVRERLAENISDIEFGGTMLSMSDIQRKWGIVSLPVWVSIGVSLISIEGLARHFDREMNIVQTISPHLKKYLRQLYLMDPKLKRAS